MFSTLLGLFVVLISPDVESGGSIRSNITSNSNSGERYKVSLDEAKKAAFKGEIENLPIELLEMLFILTVIKIIQVGIEFVGDMHFIIILTNLHFSKMIKSTVIAIL